MKRKNSIRVLLALIFTTTLACAMSTPGPSPTQTQEPVQVQTPPLELITIQTGSDPNEPTQVPPYFLATGQGHYLLYIYETRKLIYDGSEVYSGELAKAHGGAIALSHNGLHYGYIIQNSESPDFNDLYVDGTKVMTAQYLSLPAITDDGAHYFYTACTSATGFFGTCLFRDGVDIFLHADGILEFSINSDGASYYASLRNFDEVGNFVESLVRDGEQLYKGTELAHKLFSANGQHYGYVTVDLNTGIQNLVINGEIKLSSTALFLDQLTDLGSYCAWDPAHKLVVVNGTEYPVTHEGHIRCYINNDASHSLIYDDGDWLLDGNPTRLLDVDPHDKVAEVEMADDIWYVYRLVE